MGTTRWCTRFALLVIVSTVFVSAIGVPAAAGGQSSGLSTTATDVTTTPATTAFAQDNTTEDNETATGGDDTATEDNETTAGGNDTNESESGADGTGETDSTTQACNDRPNLEQARMYAPQRTIEAGSPGQIAGGFQLDPASDCTVVVSITLSVPSGVSIEGGADYFSSGAGLTTGTFELGADSGIKDIRANVYAEETGTYRVTGDIKYWPKGNSDAAREIDSLTFTFEVEEPATPPAEDGGSESDNALPVSPPVAISFGLILAIIVGFISMTRLSPRDINLGIRK